MHLRGLKFCPDVSALNFVGWLLVGYPLVSYVFLSTKSREILGFCDVSWVNLGLFNDKTAPFVTGATGIFVRSY